MKKALPVVLLLVGVVAGKVLLGGGSSTAAAAADGTTPTTAKPGPVVTLGSTTVNLADGHILKMGLALQLSADAKVAAEPSTNSNDPTNGWAPVFDEAIRVFGEQSYAALIAPGGRDTARQLLLAKLKVRYETELDDIYFYEFVMQ